MGRQAAGFGVSGWPRFRSTGSGSGIRWEVVGSCSGCLDYLFGLITHVTQGFSQIPVSEATTRTGSTKN